MLTRLSIFALILLNVRGLKLSVAARCATLSHLPLYGVCLPLSEYTESGEVQVGRSICEVQRLA